MEYDEGEFSPDGDNATKKLVGSRVARKRAEEDVKLLANRIALLKLEEKKVFHQYSQYILNRLGKRSKIQKRKPKT